MLMELETYSLIVIMNIFYNVNAQIHSLFLPKGESYRGQAWQELGLLCWAYS